jgi:hypothetical protein
MDSLFSRRNLPVVLLNVSTILIVAIMLVVNQALAKPNQSSVATTFNSGVLSYQGSLMDSNGNRLTGTYEMTFRIYPIPSGGTHLWEEVRSGANAVPVQNGLFNVRLGSLKPIPVEVWEAPELFLGVKIGNDNEMTPREYLSNVPGANVAKVALSVPSGTITQTEAPSLVASAISENVKIYFGSDSAVSTGTNNLLTKTVSVSPACNNLVNAIVQPLYQWTPFTYATIGLPWDGSKFTVFLSRTDGYAWGDGQDQGFTYLVICQQ